MKHHQVLCGFTREQEVHAPVDVGVVLTSLVVAVVEELATVVVVDAVVAVVELALTSPSSSLPHAASSNIGAVARSTARRTRRERCEVISTPSL